mgnify:CR=1 FL=1
MKHLSHFQRPNQLLEAEKTVPKKGLFASLFVANLLGGNEGEWVNENKIEDLKFENGYWVMKVGGNQGSLWGEGAVNILKENGCEAELLDPDMSYNNPTSPYIVAKVSEFVVLEIEQKYEHDIKLIVEEMKRCAIEIVDDDDEDEEKLVA